MEKTNSSIKDKCADGVYGSRVTFFIERSKQACEEADAVLKLLQDPSQSQSDMSIQERINRVLLYIKLAQNAYKSINGAN